MKTPRKNTVRNASALLAFTVAGALPAQAALLAIDTFEDYNTTTNIRLQAGGGTGWSGAWNVLNNGSSSTPTAGTAMVTNTEITYNHGGVTLGGGQSLLLDNASNGTQRNVFSSVNTSGSDFYVSFIFQFTGTVFAGFQALDADPDINNDSIGLVNTNGAIAARVDNSNGSTAAGFVVQNTTYFMVIQYTGWTEANPQYTTVNVWINPNTGEQSESSVSATYTDTTPADGGGSSGFLGFYARTTGIDVGTERMLIDDLRIGTSWASVTAIPEPGSASLLAAGAVALFAMTGRRRRA